MLKKLKQNPLLVSLKTKYPNSNAIIVLLALIMIWRGVWGLLDRYFFPDSPALSYLLGIALGFVILYLDDIKLDNLKR